MLDSWRKQFALSKLSPIPKDPSTFIACQWQKNKTEPNLKYLAYRFIIMLIFFVSWVISIINDGGPGKWPIFLTNWGYSICTFQATLAFILLSSAVCASILNSGHKVKEKMLLLYPVYWVLNVIGTSIAFVITLVYWTVIYDAKTMEFTTMNYLVHGNNSFLMFIDLWVVAHPVVLLHVIYPILFGFGYSIFSFIYYSAGGTSKDGLRYIYKILNWDKPGVAIATIIGVLFFVVVTHMISALIALTRRHIEKKCCSKKIDITMTETKRQTAYVNEAMSTDIV